jgi:hypothetical protein
MVAMPVGDRQPFSSVLMKKKAGRRIFISMLNIQYTSAYQDLNSEKTNTRP